MTRNPDFRAVATPERADRSGDPALVRVTFPRAAAEDANKAMDQLFDAFPDHEPSLDSESADEWVFELRWTSDLRFVADPGVADAATRVMGLEMSELGKHREVLRWGGRDVVFSMVHAWALLAPALAMGRRGGKPPAWVIHLDDHTDLGKLAAAASERSGFLNDTIFGTEIEVSDPRSVTAAVERGTVSKGNFLTAYLLAHAQCQVIHVGAHVSERALAIDPHAETVEIGGTVFARTVIPLTRTADPGALAFYQTRMLPPELPPAAEGGIWLDIDLDYFCNRYDGDSDRRDHVAAAGEPGQVIARVRRFLTELADARWLGQIEAVSVAVSPGFFPADHWAEVIPVLREGLQTVLEG